MEERRFAGRGVSEREGSSSVGARMEESVGGSAGAESGLSWRGAAGCAEEGEVAEGGG